jgi:hypothetical protein
VRVFRFRVTFADGANETMEVAGRDVNAAFGKALRIAKLPWDGPKRELRRLECLGEA